MLPRIMFLLSMVPVVACSLPTQLNYGKTDPTVATDKDILALAGFETAAGIVNGNGPGLNGKPTEKSYIIATNVNMRDGPALKFDVIRILRPDQEVILTAEQGNWLQITVRPTPKGQALSGWIAKDFLKVKS